MTEAELQAQVIALCGRLGLLVHHCRHASSCDGKGFPDLVIAGPGGVLLAELKGEDGETSPEQDMWGWTLDRSGVWRLWRPGDWRSHRIQSALARISG